MQGPAPEGGASLSPPHAWESTDITSRCILMAEGDRICRLLFYTDTAARLTASSFHTSQGHTTHHMLIYVLHSSVANSAFPDAHQCFAAWLTMWGMSTAQSAGHSPVLAYHTQTAGSGPLSTSDSVKTFLSGLQYEAKKGYNNLQVRTSSKLLGFKAETHTGQPTQGPCMLFAELCMLVCVLG